jgi:hypothetical protein
MKVVRFHTKGDIRVEDVPRQALPVTGNYSSGRYCAESVEPICTRSIRNRSPDLVLVPRVLLVR